jgi:hypothetical protein
MYSLPATMSHTHGRPAEKTELFRLGAYIHNQTLTRFARVVVIIGIRALYPCIDSDVVSVV